MRISAMVITVDLFSYPKRVKKAVKSRRSRKTRRTSWCSVTVAPAPKRVTACTVSEDLRRFESNHELLLMAILTCLQPCIAPPEPKTDQKFSNEDKAQHELVRRWRVVIQDIEIINQTNKVINPFIKFIIGGDYYVSRGSTRASISKFPFLRFRLISRS